MADTAKATKPKSKVKKAASSRALHAARQKRLKQKKAAGLNQSTRTAEAPTTTPDASTETTQEVAATTMTNGAAPVETTSPQTAEISAPKQPKQPENAWGVTKQSAQPPQRNGLPSKPPRQEGRVNGTVPKSGDNNHPSLAMPGPARSRPAPAVPNDRGQLFGRRQVASPPRQTRPPAQRMQPRTKIQDRLRRRELVEAMPDDYQAKDYSQPRRAMRRPATEEEPRSIRPSGPSGRRQPPRPRPNNQQEPKRLQRDRRPMMRNGGPTLRNGGPARNGGAMRNGGPMRNGSDRPTSAEERPLRKTTTSGRRMNGSTSRPLSSSSSSRSKKSTPKSTVSRTPSSGSSDISSPSRRKKKNLRSEGMSKVKNVSGQRIIKKKPTSIDWLHGSDEISDPAKEAPKSTLNPEAPFFETTAIYTPNGNFLNDDFYRLTQPAPQFPVVAAAPAPQPVTPAEQQPPDFSQAANNNLPTQQMYPDMFGTDPSYYGQNYQQAYVYDGTGHMSNGPPPHATHVPPQFGFGNYPPNDFESQISQFHSTNYPGAGGYLPSTTNPPTQAPGPYSGTPNRYPFQNGMASGTASTSVSTSQDFSQMMMPTHFPNGAVNGTGPAINGGGAGQAQSNASGDLTGASSAAVSEASRVNGNDPAITESYLYDNGATGYFGTVSAM